MSQLPRDLVEEEILCRVPATSLRRLRSTCKRWNRLFNDSRFARNHFEKAKKQSFVLMLTKEFRIFSLNVHLRGIPSAEFEGELSLFDRCSSNSAILDISQVFHCDGLLLCTIKEETRIVVWNPWTGQTKWIQPRNPYRQSDTYSLGPYLDSNCGNISYKILRHERYDGGEINNQTFEIFEIKSTLWRTLDVNIDCQLLDTECRVSLRGKTYWFAGDLINQFDKGIFLVSFDYQTERFRRLCLPYQCRNPYNYVSLSLVGEQKLSVLRRRRQTSQTEVWVRNDETEVASWSKLLVVDSPQVEFCHLTSLLVEEEKKVLVCCERWMDIQDTTKSNDFVYLVGEDNKITNVDFGASKLLLSCFPLLFSYVPSLVQIQ